MRFATLPAMMIVALSVVTAPVYTQGRGNSQPKKAGATTTTKVTRTPKADARAAKSTAKTTTKTAKGTTKAARTTVKAETRLAKAEMKATRKTGTTTSAAPTTVVTPTTPTTTSVKNLKLEARLRALLPAGTTVQDASQGFKNWGQFVAAVHVSNNLNIPFADLKAKMTGITPVLPGTPLRTSPSTSTTTMSLGQAIQSLKGATTEPTPLTSTKIRTEVKKAEDAASVDLQRTRDRS